MMNLFNKKTIENSLTVREEELRNELLVRAKVNAEVRKSTNNEVLKKIDAILDEVSGFENSKITAITELYLALESGNTKNLISFFKKPDKKVKVVKKNY